MFHFTTITEKKFSMSEVAELLGVDYSTVSRLMSRGKLGHFKVGSRRIIAESHLEAYMKSVEKLAKSPRI